MAQASETIRGKITVLGKLASAVEPHLPMV